MSIWESLSSPKVKSGYGPSPRTRPLSSFLRRPPGSHRRFLLFRRQTPLPSWKITRRHRPPRRTHHFLLSDSHVPCAQRRNVPSLLAHLSLPPLIADFLEYGLSSTQRRAARLLQQLFQYFEF